MLSVIIPVYKNKEQFLKNLRNNMEFFAGCEVIAVNDDPTESLRADLQTIPGVVLIENEKNMGFGQTVNNGVKASKNDYVFLLNTDVILNDARFLTTLEQFKTNPNLFAISFAQTEKDGAIVGKNRIYWADGFFHHSKSPDILPGKNGWAEGGTCIIDKKKFLQLDGFDLLYSPFYWEDTDLSYRAWKAGYEIVFDPSVQMIHHHESTIGKYFSKNVIHTIALRNQLIFIRKNITDKSLLAEHRNAIFKMIVAAALKGEFWKLEAHLQAMSKNAEIKKRQEIQNKLNKKTDKELLDLFKT